MHSTIKEYLDSVKEVYQTLEPLFKIKPVVVARKLGIKYDTLIRRAGNNSFSPDDLKLIIEFYSDILDKKVYDKLMYIVSEEYLRVEKLTTQKVKTLPFSLHSFGKATSISYKKILDVTDGRELWGYNYLEKISIFFEYLSTIKYLSDERDK